MFSNLVGWYGVTAVLAAYVLNILSIISNDSMLYILLNLSGAIGVGLVSYQKHAFQPLLLNVVWALVALFALIQILLAL